MKIGHKKETKAEANHFDGKAYFSWHFDGDEKGRYFILWGSDVRQKIVGIGTSTLHTGRDNLDLVEVEGIPATVLRCTERYEKAVINSTNVNDAYSLITHRLAECDVRWIFPELWTAWKNAQAKKQHRREEHEYREAKKKGTLRKKTRDEKSMLCWTRMCNLRAAARRYGVL